MGVGQGRDYIPDFTLRLAGHALRHLILETKGYDPLELVKKQAAERSVSVVNVDRQDGHRACAIAGRPEDALLSIDKAAEKPRQSLGASCSSDLMGRYRNPTLYKAIRPVNCRLLTGIPSSLLLRGRFQDVPCRAWIVPHNPPPLNGRRDNTPCFRGQFARTLVQRM